MSAEKINCRYCLRSHGPGATVCASCGAPLVGAEAEAVSRAEVRPVEAAAEGEAAASAPPPVAAPVEAPAGGPVNPASHPPDEHTLLASARQQAAHVKGSQDPVTMFLLVLCCALILGAAMKGKTAPSSSAVLPSSPPKPIVPPRQVAYAAAETLGQQWMSGRKDAITFNPPAGWRTARPLFGSGTSHIVSMTSEKNDLLGLAMHLGDPLTGDPLKSAAARCQERLAEARFTDGRVVRVGLNNGVELEGTAGDRKILVVFAWNGKRSVQLTFLAPWNQYDAWAPIFRTSAATTSF